MRRILLSPPRTILGPSSWDDRFVSPTPVVDQGRSPARDRLDAPSPALERRRPLFHPRRGFVRRLERRISRWLSAAVYPRIPGIHLPYDRLLRRQLTLSEAEIALSGLPRAFEGLRVLLLSDLHAGPFLSAAAMREMLARLLTLQPELILLAGDLTTCRPDELEHHADALRSLSAPLGVFAVLGNHDHYSGKAEEVRALVERLGITVLHNRFVSLRRAEECLAIAGVDDLLLGQPDLDTALRGAPEPVVLLAHNPDMLFDAARREVALMLSGHTHGGQIRLPGLPVLVRQSRYRLDEGRFRVGRTELVVSRGIGAVGLPWRVACPPEAVLLRLKKSRA